MADDANRRISVGSAMAWLSFLREAEEQKDWSGVMAVIETMEHECDVRLTAQRQGKEP